MTEDSTPGTSPAPDASPREGALAYLTATLDLLQAHALYRDRVDWPAVRAGAARRAARARTPAGTHAAIRWALGRLEDRHSGLYDPRTLRRWQQEIPPADGPRGRRLAGEIGYLVVPAVEGVVPAVLTAYLERAAAALRTLAAPPLRGWVVDLRGNTGGNMWPMLAAVGPLLGAGEVGAFAYPDGRRQIWAYRDGQALCDGVVRARLPGAPPGPAPGPVAVLTDGRTGSSGEGIAVAFRGRPGARSFGAPTAGLPTANEGYPLSDGAWLELTVARMADRTGRAYEAPLAPDEAVATTGPPGDPAGDAVLRAALGWLRGH